MRLGTQVRVVQGPWWNWKGQQGWGSLSEPCTTRPPCHTFRASSPNWEWAPRPCEQDSQLSLGAVVASAADSSGEKASPCWADVGAVQGGRETPLSIPATGG